MQPSIYLGIFSTNMVSRNFRHRNYFLVLLKLKPLSVTTNVVGLQTDEAGHVDQNSSAHVARVVGLQIDAVVVTETRLRDMGNFELLILNRIVQIQLLLTFFSL